MTILRETGSHKRSKIIYSFFKTERLEGDLPN